MDEELYSRHGKKRPNWFRGAEIVTGGPRGLGGIDWWNLGFVTDAEEKYLRSVHLSLAPHNYRTFGNGLVDQC